MSVATEDFVDNVADLPKRKSTSQLHISTLLHSLNSLKTPFNPKPKNNPWPGRRRGSTQSNRSVHFDRSPEVRYTFSKEDYDRGGSTPDKDDMPPSAEWKTKRPPLLDDTDEDDSRRSIVYQVPSQLNDVPVPHVPTAASPDVQTHLDSIEAHIQTLKNSLDTPYATVGSSAIQMRRLLYLLDSSANEIRELTHHGNKSKR
ncbi:hypothetical protein BGW37DRAFT_524341 [Umbelopsis sp. PMI_123]|nr:hypothetical protein BGW37DRAFT_524341 [Umbelopsis sp. PMI_123]